MIPKVRGAHRLLFTLAIVWVVETQTTCKHDPSGLKQDNEADFFYSDGFNSFQLRMHFYSFNNDSHNTQYFVRSQILSYNVYKEEEAPSIFIGDVQVYRLFQSCPVELTLAYEHVTARYPNNRANMSFVALSLDPSIESMKCSVTHNTCKQIDILFRSGVPHTPQCRWADFPSQDRSICVDFCVCTDVGECSENRKNYMICTGQTTHNQCAVPDPPFNTTGRYTRFPSLPTSFTRTKAPTFRTTTTTKPRTTSSLTTLPSNTSTTTGSTTTQYPYSLDQLGKLAKLNLTLENVSETLNQTFIILTIHEGELNSTDVDNAAQIISNAANVQGLPKWDAEAVLLNVDTLLANSDYAFQESSIGVDPGTTRVLNSFPALVANTASSQLKYLHGRHLGFSSIQSSCHTDVSGEVGIRDDGNLFVQIDDASLREDESTYSSITVPVDAICNTDGSHTFFTIYRNRKLFYGSTVYQVAETPKAWMEISYTKSSPYDNQDVDVDDADSESYCDTTTKIVDDTPVLSATILAVSVAEDGTNSWRTISRADNAQKMATATLNKTGVLFPLHAKLVFTWWDDVRQVWSGDDRCNLTHTRGGSIVAECDHLTDFTLLVEGNKNDPCVCDTLLMVLSYVVASLSILCLLIVVFVMVINRAQSLRNIQAFRVVVEESRHLRAHSIDVLYAATLLFFYICFTLFQDQRVARNLCKAFAVINYSALVCVILLTFFQSFRIVSTFSRNSSVRGFFRFASSLLCAASFSIVLPLLLSTILAICSNFFDRNDGFCWVHPAYVVFAVVIPISLLLVNGIACTVIVIARLVYERQTQLYVSKGHIKQRIISILMMQFTLGMPWILQYLTLLAPTTTVFHYLFTVVNGSQGVVLFALYAYKRRRRLKSVKKRRRTIININRPPIVVEDERLSSN